MKKKRKTWKDKLTAAERKHLKNDAGVVTKIQLLQCISDHERQRKEQIKKHGKVIAEPCHTCNGIAAKLDMKPVNMVWSEMLKQWVLDISSIPGN